MAAESQVFSRRNLSSQFSHPCRPVSGLVSFPSACDLRSECMRSRSVLLFHDTIRARAPVLLPRRTSGQTTRGRRRKQTRCRRRCGARCGRGSGCSSAPFLLSARRCCWPSTCRCGSAHPAVCRSETQPTTAAVNSSIHQANSSTTQSQRHLQLATTIPLHFPMLTMRPTICRRRRGTSSAPFSAYPTTTGRASCRRG